MKSLRAWLDKPGFPFGLTNRDRLKAALFAAGMTFVIVGVGLLAIAGLCCLITHR
jgi:hypothetical protein